MSNKKKPLIGVYADGKYIQVSEEDLVKEFTSIVSKLLEKREPFVLIVEPLKGKGYVLASPEVACVSPLDVLLLEAKTQRSVIELFDKVISVRSKLRGKSQKPSYIG